MFASTLIVGAFLLSQMTEPPNTKADESRQIRRLIRQLDDDLLTTRQAAEEALVAMGPGIIDDLPPVAVEVSPEMKERLSRVRKTLEVKLARTAVEPTRVTLSGEMDSTKAFDTIQKQTGNQFAGHDEHSTIVTLDFEETPFWQAVDELLDQCKLTSNPYGTERKTISLQPRPEGQLPRSEKAVYAGLFRINATQVSAVKDLRTPQAAGLRVRVTIEWEPRITPISLSIPLSEIMAEDDQGSSVSSPNARGNLNATVCDDFNMVEIDLPLELPDRSSKRISRLKGTLDVMMPGQVEAFEFDAKEDSKQLPQTRAGATVTLQRIAKNEDVYEVNIRIQFEESAGALESHLGWVLRNEAYLDDGKGNRLDFDGIERRYEAENEVGIAYLFAVDELPAGGKFVLKTPVLIVHSSVPFEMEDIELP